MAPGQGDPHHHQGGAGWSRGGEGAGRRRARCREEGSRVEERRVEERRGPGSMDGGLAGPGAGRMLFRK